MTFGIGHPNNQLPCTVGGSPDSGCLNIRCQDSRRPWKIALGTADSRNHKNASRQIRRKNAEHQTRRETLIQNGLKIRREPWSAERRPIEQTRQPPAQLQPTASWKTFYACISLEGWSALPRYSNFCRARHPGV